MAQYHDQCVTFLSNALFCARDTSVGHGAIGITSVRYVFDDLFVQNMLKEKNLFDEVSAKVHAIVSGENGLDGYDFYTNERLFAYVAELILRLEREKILQITE